MLCLWGLNLISLFSQEEPDDFEELKLYVAQPKTVPASNPRRVAVARPEVADVRSVTNNEIVLEPKSMGVTSLFVWDDYGQHAYQLRVFTEDLTELKRHADSILRELKMPGIKIKMNEAEGKLVLTGESDNLNNKERLLSALGSLKEKILDLVIIKEERNLVKIDMEVLEVNRDDIKKLGINYTDSTKLTDNASKLMNKITDMFATSMWTRAAMDTTINHLINEGKIRVLSQPKIVCLSGKEAEFLVGGQYPIVTTTTTTTSTSSNVQFKDYGIIMSIKPVVSDEENIFINVSAEISDIDSAVTVSGVPGFLTRTTKTELYLKNGYSLVISGLIKNKEANTVEKFPGLAELPVLGLLFRSRDFQNKRTELVIMLTPTIVEGSPVLKNTPSAKTRPQGYESKTEAALREFKDGTTDAFDPSLSRPFPTMPGSRIPSIGNRDPGLSGKGGKVYLSGLDSYIDDIKSQIVSSIGYPSLARELGAAGTVKVRLRILSDGGLKEILIIGSSGSELLDNSTVRSIKKLAPFPSFPGSIERNEIAVDIPIVYS